MGTVTLAARVLIALIFAIAGMTKLLEPGAARNTLREFGVGERLAQLGVLLAPAELAVAVGLAFVPTARWSAIAAMLLLVIFIGGMLNALRSGRRPHCGCFGGLRPTPIGTLTLLRNGVLLLLAGLVVAFGPGSGGVAWVRSHDAIRIGLFALVIAAATAGLALGRRSPEDSAEISALSGLPAAGPGVGDPAPEFNTSDTDAEQQTLTSLCSGGHAVVLIFGSAGCGSCATTLSQLPRWQATLADRLQFAVVGAGDADQARLTRDEYGLTRVLLDTDRTIWRAYGVRVVPTAFAVTPEGTISSGPAMGPDAIEDLVRLTLHRHDRTSHAWSSTIHVA